MFRSTVLLSLTALLTLGTQIGPADAGPIRAIKAYRAKRKALRKERQQLRREGRQVVTALKELHRDKKAAAKRGVESKGGLEEVGLVTTSKSSRNGKKTTSHQLVVNRKGMFVRTIKTKMQTKRRFWIGAKVSKTTTMTTTKRIYQRRGLRWLSNGLFKKAVPNRSQAAKALWSTHTVLREAPQEKAVSDAITKSLTGK